MAQRLPSSSLEVRHGGEWREIWRADRAPARWAEAHPVMTRAIRWRTIGPGMEWGEVSLSGDGAAWRLRLILVRLDPSRLEVRLTERLREGGTRGAWTVDSMPDGAIVAFNAGQFRGGRSWGWVVRDGRERQPPGRGALGMAFVVDSARGGRLVEPDSIAGVRKRGGLREALQSYPMLLAGDGQVPNHLRAAGWGVDLEHRDSRLALGQLRDGRLLLALTRFEGLGGVLDVLPFGPTIPEMAAIMGALGCRAAMLLDGGLSGQLALREPDGRVRAWPGLRGVPLGLTVRARR